MRFRVLALDYDGTIAENGRLHPDVRAAIEEVRARGIAVVLVTGRILADLQRQVGDLRFLDAVVAEGGATLTFPPQSGRSFALAPPPPPVFLEELRRRGVSAVAGECVVEAEASLAHRVLDVIRERELPLVILFNRSRLMVLPQSVSKATGLRDALSALRLSSHNAIGVGDAENDHALLEACELGLAVAWGSAALKASADEVLEGTGPAAVAAYIRRVGAEPRLTRRRPHRHRLLLGFSDDGQPQLLAVRGRNVLIAGDPGSGKSWMSGLICEQLILQRYSVCVIDPEGDYGPLEALPGVLVLGQEGPPSFRDVERAFRFPEVSVVVDLSTMPLEQRLEYVPSLLHMLAAVRRETGLPHRIVVDEAHYFLEGPDAANVLDLELAAYTLVTCQASRLDPRILGATEAIVVTCENDPEEVRALRARLGGQGTEAEWREALGGVETNRAVLLTTLEPEGVGPRRFRMAPRLTPHVRHRHKYTDVPVPAGQAFVFTRRGVPTGQSARTLTEFAAIAASSPRGDVEGHLQRHDVSRWIEDVFRDRLLAAEVFALEERQCRAAAADVNASLAKLIRERYLLRDATGFGPGLDAERP